MKIKAIFFALMNQYELFEGKGASTRYERGLGDSVDSDKKQHQQDETSPPERIWRCGRRWQNISGIESWLSTYSRVFSAKASPCVRCVKVWAFRKPSVKPSLKASCCLSGTLLFFSRVSRLSTSKPLSRVRKPCKVQENKPPSVMNSLRC